MTTVFSPEAFRSAFRPCYAKSWDELVAWAIGDPVDAGIVEHLRGLIRSGVALDPIVVDAKGELANGRHRVAALLLEDMPITVGPYDCDTRGFIVDLEVAVSPGVDVDDLLFDQWSHRTRSFMVGPGRAGWAECVCLSGTRKLGRHTLRCRYLLGDDLGEELKFMLLSELSDLGLDARVVAVIRCVDAWFDFDDD